MSASPYSSVQKAREQLAARLVEVRKDAGINSRELARRLGWYESKVSRIANAITPPSEDDIRAWCEACGADQKIPGLIASLRLAEGAYVEWRRMERAGLRAAQELVLPLYERTRRFRAYSSSVLPGMIQTRAYTTAVLWNVQSLRGLVDDVEEAVEARMDRQRLLDARGKAFAFVLEEQVLWTQVADEETMAGQLGHLLTIMATRPNVSLGIIPRTARRERSPGESFWIHDATQASVELTGAYLTIKEPREIALYEQAFADYSAVAVYGSGVMKLIASAVDALGRNSHRSS